MVLTREPTTEADALNEFGIIGTGIEKRQQEAVERLHAQYIAPSAADPSDALLGEAMQRLNLRVPLVSTPVTPHLEPLEGPVVEEEASLPVREPMGPMDDEKSDLGGPPNIALAASQVVCPIPGSANEDTVAIFQPTSLVPDEPAEVKADNSENKEQKQKEVLQSVGEPVRATCDIEPEPD